MLPVPLRLCQGWLQTCPSQGCLPVFRDTIQHDVTGQLFCPVRDDTSRDLSVEQQTRHKIIVTCWTKHQIDANQLVLTIRPITHYTCKEASQQCRIAYSIPCRMSRCLAPVRGSLWADQQRTDGDSRDSISCNQSQVSPNYFVFIINPLTPTVAIWVQL